MDITCKNLIPIGSSLDQFTTLRVVDCVSKETIQSGVGELFIESKIRRCVLHENSIEMNDVVGSVPTGDLVEIKSGTIYYKTRLNNMVKIFGRKVNLTKIENTTKSNWSIENVCCAYDNATNSLNLFVQCGNGHKYTKKEILQGLRQKLLDQEVPNEIYFVDEFPLSCHGKISKSKLLDSIKKPVNCLHGEYFITKLEENLPSFNIAGTLELPFLAAGGNSVLALQLVNELENKFNINDEELITMLLNNDINIEQILLRVQNCEPNQLTKTTSETASLVSSIWSHDMGKCIDATPTICRIENKYIVSVGSHSHQLINVDLISGQLLSKLKLPNRIECQVVQYKNYGIVGCYDGFVYCFDICNGMVKWKFDSGGMVKSRVYIVGDILVFGNYNSESNVWCLRADDGVLIWTKKIGNKSIYSGIIGNNTDLFVTTLDGVCAAVELFTGKSLWETRLQSPIFSTPKIVRNALLVAEVLGVVHCIYHHDGKILSSYKANGNIYSSIESIGENLICFGCYDKSVYCISIDPDAPLFKLLWKVETSGQIFSTPKFFMFDSNNLVLICTTNGFVSVLDINGKLLKQFRVNGDIFSTPCVIMNKAIVASRNNLLYCYEIDQILSND